LTLSDLVDEARVADRLAASTAEAPAAPQGELGGKAQMFAGAARALIDGGVGPAKPARAFFIPGRVEVLGKHTDYCGGRSLVAAVSQGFCLIAVAGDGPSVRAIDAGRDETVEFEIDPELKPQLGHWSNYPMTVARRLARNFPGPLRGGAIGFASDLPPDAGLASSSAMIVAFYLALAAINDLADTQEYRRNIDSVESLAGYLGTVENGQSFRSLAGDRGVGTFGGSQDHTAILCCRSGQLRQYSYSPVRFEREIPLPPGLVFVIAASGVQAAKTGQARLKYNRASALASAGAKAWRQATGRSEPHFAAIIAGGPDAADRMRQILRDQGISPPRGHGDDGQAENFAAPELLERFDQFLAESEQIVPNAGDALAAEDLGTLRQEVRRSQQLTDEMLHNQVPETIFLARSADELGAAASAFGAGFGGSVWALVAAADAEAFRREWSDGYMRAYPSRNARFFFTEPGPAAMEMKG